MTSTVRSALFRRPLGSLSLSLSLASAAAAATGALTVSLTHYYYPVINGRRSRRRRPGPTEHDNTNSFTSLTTTFTPSSRQPPSLISLQSHEKKRKRRLDCVVPHFTGRQIITANRLFPLASASGTTDKMLTNQYGGPESQFF